MKNIIIAFCSFIVFSITAKAQVFEPVKWKTSVEKISDTEYDLISSATIDKGWHLYSQNVPEDGPIPTTFNYTISPKFELKGKTLEEEGHTIDDPIFEMKIKFFGDKAEFRQRISVLNQELSIVEGEVEFMVCDDSKCLPPEYIELKFNLATAEKVETSESDSNVFQLEGSDDTSQILEPVKWISSVEKISDSEYILVSKATIDKGWKLYSQSVPEDGPIPTEFMYELPEGVELVGKTSEEKGKEVEDKVFNMKIKFFKNTAEFRQQIKLNSTDIKSVVGEVGFMACDDEKCLTPSYIDLNFDLTTSVSAKSGAEVSDNGKDTDGNEKSLWSIFIIACLLYTSPSPRDS